MEIEKLATPEINQNGYHKNIFTKERIGTLFIYPIDFTPEDCFSCEGYSLLISDYEDLYKVIGTKFNYLDDPEGTFRIPDYNITKRFLQPGDNAGNIIEAGLPNIEAFIALRVGIISPSGAFYEAHDEQPVDGATSGRYGGNIGFNAARCSSIYGNSATVQPPSQIVHICIKYK